MSESPSCSFANTGPLAARLLLAQDPATPPAQLQDLGLGPNSRAIKQAVAGNPNTPPALLLALAGRYWQAFLENPVLPLLLLEDPGLPHRLPLRVLRALVRREGMPPLILQTLARHPDREVREGARFHVDAEAGPAVETAPEDWRQLLRRELEKLPAQRATLPEMLDLEVVPNWLLEAVAGTSNRILQAAVISVSQRPGASLTLQATGSMLRRAVGEPHMHLHRTKYADYKRYHRVGRGALTAAEVARLSLGSPTWQVLAAKSAALDGAALERLARSSHWQVGAALASNPNLTLSAAMQLVARGDVRVLRRLVRSRVIPDTLLPNLARSADEDVRGGVARHPRTPIATLAQLATDGSAWVRQMTAANRRTPLVALAILVADTDPKVRERVAFNPQADEAIYEKLLVDDSKKLRQRLAGDARLPPAIIQRFYDDPDREVRHRAFFNRRTPRHVLDYIVEQGWAPPGERAPLPAWGTAKGWDTGGARLRPLSEADEARNDRVRNDPTVTEEELADWVVTAGPLLKWNIAGKTKSVTLLAGLAVDTDVQVRRYVASNEHAPLDLLRALANDPKKKVRYGAGENTTVAVALPEVLAQLATDRKAFVRRSVARNHRTPPALLDRLANDADPDTRDWAASNPNTGAGTLTRLGQLPLTGRLRSSVLSNLNTPIEVLLAWQKTDADNVAPALASNPATPVAVLWQLARQPIVEDARDVRYTIGSNPNAPAELLDWLWDNRPPGEEGEKIGWSLVGNARTSEALLARLVQESTESICTFLVKYPHFSPELLERLLPLLDAKKKERLAMSDKVPEYVLNRLFDDGEQKVLERMARSRDTPRSLMHRLAAPPAVGKWAQVGMNLLDNLAAPPEVLQAVLAGRATEDAANGTPWWYAVVVENRNVTSSILDQLVARLVIDQQAGRDCTGHYAQQIWVNLARNPLLRPVHLQHFAYHPSREVREALLQRLDCPPALRAEMRATVLVRNLTEPSSVLGRASALAAADTHVDWLRKLHPKAGWVERLAMIENPNLPADLLAVLAQDAHRLVRAAAQQRQATGQVPDLMGG